MHLPCLFSLIVIIVIPGLFNSSPGDPFPQNLDDTIDLSYSVHRSNISNDTSTHLSSFQSMTDEISIKFNANHAEADPVDDNDLPLISSTTTVTSSSSEILPIDTHSLIQIAQWKHTDPKTNHTRYWYHSVDSEMGSGWMQDGIAFQAYAELKPNTIPVHLFHSETKGVWTNTVQLESTPPTIGNNQWKYDGVLFYAYNSSMNSTLLKPVWRYWNRINHGTEDVRQPRRALLYIGDQIKYDLPEWILDRRLFYTVPPYLRV